MGATPAVLCMVLVQLSCCCWGLCCEHPKSLRKPLQLSVDCSLFCVLSDISRIWYGKTNMVRVLRHRCFAVRRSAGFFVSPTIFWRSICRLFRALIIHALIAVLALRIKYVRRQHFPPLTDSNVVLTSLDWQTSNYQVLVWNTRAFDRARLALLDMSPDICAPFVGFDSNLADRF